LVSAQNNALQNFSLNIRVTFDLYGLAARYLTKLRKQLKRSLCSLHWKRQFGCMSPVVQSSE